MAKVNQKKLEDIVQPTLVFDGDKEHALKALFRNDNAPILKTIGYGTIPGVEGYGRFVSYVLTSQGDKVLSIEVGQPNLKAIVEDEAKIAFVTTFMENE
jgi:hypothetical protein